MLRLLSLLSAAFANRRSVQVQAPCNDAPDLQCRQLEANGLTFDCRFVGPAGGIPVMLLHGFPEFSRHWIPLMSYWGKTQANISAFACDLRGYSVGASPTDVNQYDYKILRDDVWALADAAGFSAFHLVGHDHGSVLGYFAASSDQAESRLLSYTGISVPHPDALSDEIDGSNVAQSVNVNYFNQFELVDSAEQLWPLFGGAEGGLFPTQQSCQSALWWYWGIVGKYFTRPPVYDEETVTANSPNFLIGATRAAIPIAPRPAKLGSERYGKSRVRSMFICGNQDDFLLCTQPYAKDASFYAKSFDYADFPCAHNLFTECKDQATVDAVIDTITSFVLH